MATVTSVITKIQAIVAGVTGISSAPSEVKDATIKFPFAFSYPLRGQLFMEANNAGRDIHVIATEIHLGGTITSKTVAQAKTLLELVSKALKSDPGLSGEGVVQWGRDTGVSYIFGRLEWAGEEHLGFRLEIPVKIRKAVST